MGAVALDTQNTCISSDWCLVSASQLGIKAFVDSVHLGLATTSKKEILAS